MGGFASSNAQAQAVPDLPRLDFYVARDLYEAGNIGEATEGFRIALNRGQVVKQQRWIDSIPALVMLGECYYQQGAIGQALEQYDAAMMVLLSNQAWIENVRGPDAQPDAGSDLRGIQWTKLTRRTQLLRVPRVMQVASEAGAAAAVRLDVSEVLRCSAIALYRRWQLLGPLGKYSPLTSPLAEYLSKTQPGNAPWVASAWKGLGGLAKLAKGETEQALAQLNEATVVENQFDYYLTPQFLIAGALIDVQQKNIASALNRLGDASLRAAQLEQADALAECLMMIGQLACAQRRSDLLPVLQAAGTWTQKVSVLAYLNTCAVTSELAAISGNMQVHDAIVKQMLTSLREKDVGLPRIQAALGYSMARAAAAQNQSGAALVQLDTSVNMLRGSQLTGAATPRVFQTQMILELLSRGDLPDVAGEEALGAVLGEPSDEQWLLRPLECMVSVSTSHLGAYEKWLELAARRNDSAAVIDRMDDVQRERFYEVLPMGGRLLAVRQALMAGRSQWPATVSQNLESSLKAYPGASTLPVAIQALHDSFAQESLVADDRQLSVEGKKKSQELIKYAENLENVVTSIAMSRTPIARDWPRGVSSADMQQILGNEDVVISYVQTSKAIYGAAISKQAQHTWIIAEGAQVDAKIAILLTQLGLNSLPSLDVQSPKLAWRVTASELAQQLLPAEARVMLKKAQRLIIVPSGNLWYMPFELMPAIENDPRTPLLAKHAICYVPTLAHVGNLKSTSPKCSSSVGLYSNFFAVDRAANQALAAKIIPSSSNSLQLDMQQKAVGASPRWLRFRADQLWVASEITMGATPWETRLCPIEGAADAALANWMQSPLCSPARVYLPGYQSSAALVEMKGGNEIFVPACTLSAAGCKSLWMSRWSVGGRSAQLIMNRLAEELEYESPSSAWQRAAIALWAENLNTSDEPIIANAKAKAKAITKTLPATISGEHPLLWGGYMMIGDHQAP